MRSQQFSVGVFFFMLVSIFVFSAIVYAVVFGKYAPKTMRLGEKIMFGGNYCGYSGRHHFWSDANAFGVSFLVNVRG